MRLAFLDLPDDRVDLISLARQSSGVEIVLVVHPDTDALALKIAEVLQIPRSSEPLDILALKPDRVALPSLEAPGASALLRAGISSQIFVRLDDLGTSLGAKARADATGDPNPLDQWEELFDEATGARLGKIQEALALSEDRQRLFREILALAMEQSGADAGSIMVLDPETAELRIAFADGLSSDTVRTARQKLGEGIAGKVAQEGRPMIIHERVTDPRLHGERERHRIAAAMSAPIQLDGRVFGVLNVSSDRPDKRFLENDLARLVETAGRISAILERVVSGQRRDLDAIEFRARKAMEQAFAREDLTYHEQCRAAAARLAEILEAGSVKLLLEEGERGRLTLVSSGAGAGEDFPKISKSDGLVERSLSAGESFFLASRLKRPGSEPGSESAPNLIVVPIGDPPGQGVLLVECLRRVADDLEELTRLVTRLAGFLGRQTDAQRGPGVSGRRAALLGKLADIAPRLMVVRDRESLLAEALGALRDLFGRGLVSVRLVESNGSVAMRSAFEGSEGDRSMLTELDETLAGLALDQGTESSSDSGAGEAGPDGQAEFAVVPIRSSDHVAGALGVAVPAARGGATGLNAHHEIAGVELEALRKLALYVSLASDRVRSSGGEVSSIHDPTTGLLAGSGFESRVLEEVKRAERYHDRFLITLCAISGFDRLVERHGRDWAEGLIREFAEALSRNVREVDAVARIGGGRFAVLSPETDKDSGALLKRLDLLLPKLSTVRALGDPDEVRLVGRQYTYPDEIPTGGELLALLRSSYAPV
jgi:GGDEF domain-containing protein